jgi:hypothetical protein
VVAIVYGVAFSYWAWIGSIALFFLSWQDFFNKMRVDDRRNWFMMGISISILSHVKQAWYYILLVILLALILNILINYFKLLGGGDANAIFWIYTGFGFIALQSLVSYLFIFITVYAGHMLGKIFFMRIKKVKTWNTPFFIIIFLSFVLNNYYLGYY